MNSMHFRRLIAIAPLALLLAVPLALADEPRAPDVLGSLRFRRVRVFDQPGLGYSMVYDGDGSVLTVFVYDRTDSTIPDGIESDLVQAQFRTAIEGVLRSTEWEAAELLCTGSRPVRSGSANVPDVLEAYFRLSKRSEPMQSAILLAGWHRHFIKLRWTAKVGSPDLDPSSVQLVLESLFTQTDVWLARQ